jgi:hypothetical protein
MKRLISVLTLTLSSMAALADAPAIAGKWQFALDMSHGKRTGTLNVQQDGGKLSGTGELEKHGSSALTGTIEGAKVSIRMVLHGGSFTLLGTIEGGEMSGTTDPKGGTWTATKRAD